MRLAELTARPQRVQGLAEGQALRLELQPDGSWSRRDIKVSLQNGTVTVQAGISAVEEIRIFWKQEIDREVRILGDQFERGYGDLAWRGLEYGGRMPWYCLIHDGKETAGFGVRTGSGALCFWQCGPGWLCLVLDVRCGGAGVRLAGRALRAAELVSFSASDPPFAAACKFCGMLCRAPRLPQTPVYGGNDWYCNYGDSSHAAIMKHAQKIAGWAQGSETRPYMVIDDGWQICHGGHHAGTERFNGGPWDRGNYRFPDMPGLAAEISGLGVRPGIWYRPLTTAEKVPERMLLARKSGYQVLDPSTPEALERIETDMRRLTEWGFEMIKHDFSTFDLFGKWGFQMGAGMTEPGWTFADTGKTTAEIILNFYAALRRAAGSSCIIGCNTVSHLSAGIFEIQRTGDDTSGREWARTRKMGVNTLAFRMPQHGRFYAADADCVGITHKIPWEQNRNWLKLLGASGTPLFISVEDMPLTEGQETEIQEAFRIASAGLEPAEPLDWLYNLCPERWRINGAEERFDWT